MKAFRVTLLLALVTLSAIGAPQSYPLKVRGWQQLRIWSERTATPSLVKLIVEFRPAGQAAGRGLRPGEGSWVDRGMRSGEPGRLEYYVHESDAQRIVDSLHTAANYYVFECYNTNRGYMQVTKAYPRSVRID